ncbi:hypothetical protein KJA16_01000 [Patescibacteria group bacterium]|nr:hypothetical protein [Patescibacteria group bacterium]
MIEEIKESTNDKLLDLIEKDDELNRELLRITEKGGEPSIEIAEELLSRKGLTLPKIYLLTILQYVKSVGIGAKRATKIKERAAKRIERRGFLDKGSLLTILREIGSQEILESVIRKYLGENEDIPNGILRRMIRRIELFSLKKTLARRVLDQNPSTDDFLVIEEELEDLEEFPEGSPLQIEALEKHWEIGMSLEDFVWLAGAVKSLLDSVWETGKEKGMIEKLSVWQLYDIWDSTDSPGIRTKAKEKLEPLIPEELERRKRTLQEIHNEIQCLEKQGLRTEIRKKLESKQEAFRKMQGEIQELEEIERNLSEEGGEEMEISIAPKI